MNFDDNSMLTVDYYSIKRANITVALFIIEHFLEP